MRRASGQELLFQPHVNGDSVAAPTERKSVESLAWELEALRHSMDMKEGFIDLVSHQLRAPITTILGNGQLLARSSERLSSGDIRASLDDIVTGAMDLEANVEHLVLLSRLDNRALELQPIALPQMVKENLALFSRSHSDKRIVFSSEADVPPVLGQKSLISMVIQNLLSNASKYSPQGSLIEVSVLRSASGEPTVAVRDHGIGLSESDLGDIFKPLFRSRNARALASGMGLGLAACHRAMKIQNGSIIAMGRPGEGAVFSFSLQPIHDDEVRSDQVTVQTVDGSRILWYGLSKRELETLTLVAAGLGDKQIGHQLGVSHFTVSKHVSSILHKMGAESRTEAGVRAHREGLIPEAPAGAHHPSMGRGT